MNWQDNLKNMLSPKEDDLHIRFRAFLRYNNLLKEFEYNMKNYSILNKNFKTDNLLSYLKEVDSDDMSSIWQRGHQYINWAFYWEETAVGHDFWNGRNDEWRDLL